MNSKESTLLELRGVSKAISEELQDHFEEDLRRRLALGLSPEEARRQSLASLGDVASLARELEQARRDPLWKYSRSPWELKLLVAGWIAFSLLCLSRICTHPNPTYLSIGICVAFGLVAGAIGLSMLHRRETLRRWACHVSVAMAFALLVKSALAGEMPVLLPFAPLYLAVFAIGAFASAWLLCRESLRNCFL
ncbi:MAG: hypothetical protein JNL10_22510 [Verrucomicrobiales bacterium]|nr:hypothetical protein [Verrucomicrobiales bacterium]